MTVPSSSGRAPDPPLLGRLVGAVAGVAGGAGVARETRATEADDSLLWPEERPAISKAGDKRRRDYILGRRCARLAMADLGIDPRPVLRGPNREPLWPDGVVGSITHTTDYAGAVVARAADLLSIGVDAEPNAPLPDGIATRIAGPEEIEWLDRATGRHRDAGLHADRLLFCIKEATYKAWFPVVGRWLGFQDASVELDMAHETFTVRILVDGPIRSMSGRFGFDDGFVVALIGLGHHDVDRENVTH